MERLGRTISEKEVFSKDELLTNVMLYWINNTFGTAIRIYWESHHRPWSVKSPAIASRHRRASSFLPPRTIVPLLKERVEKYYNVVRFRYMEHGGHYSRHLRASRRSTPRKLREFFRPLRDAK